MTKEEKDPKKDKENTPPKLKGRYTSVLGKRKRASAQVRMYKKGTGIIIINEKSLKEYFSATLQTVALQPLKLTGNLKTLDFSCLVHGGGKKGQAEAIRHAFTLALVKLDDKLKPALKAKGWVTRDARKKERKKPGLKKARRAPQWSKR